MLRQLGKFEIRRVLGQGGHSTVFLAHDPQLDREVAIKLLRLARGRSRTALLDEARTAGRLRHPNIAAVHEVGEDAEASHIVFEYIEGRPLDRVIGDDGPMQAPRAVGLMIGILDALAHAHAAGVVHRDLKPSNIMLDRDGRPRVMDFGIALRPGGQDSTQPGALMGTPVYMAPEYIAHGTVAPSNDVFAAGLILYEMVFGRRAIDAGTDFEALHRIVNEPLVFPPDAFERADEALVDLIAKATARDPALRYASAAQMQQALRTYLEPAPIGGGEGRSSSGTLDFLLRRMQHRTDFPSMSAAMTAVNRLSQSEQGDASRLSAEILKDFALTNKLLRVANSAHYNTGRSGAVSTVSRAIVVLGFDAVRSLALSLMLFERLQDKQHAEALKEEFLRALMSAILARGLGSEIGGSGAEEYFVCAIFHNLGRLLAQYYLREEAQAVSRLLVGEGTREEMASRRVLGISYRELGIGVARSWGFPGAIVSSMETMTPPRTPPVTADERLRMVSTVADVLCQAIEHGGDEQRNALVQQTLKPWVAALPVEERRLRAVVDRAVDSAAELAGVLQLNLRHAALGRQLLDRSGKSQAAGGRIESPLEGGATAGPAEEPQAVLAAGIQDLSQGLLEDLGRGDLMRIVVETAYRAIGARRVLLCLRDERDRSLVGRHAFGEDGALPWDRFRIAAGGTDLFSLLIARNADLLVQDASEPKVRDRLPAWYRSGFSAPCFLVMTLRRGDQTLGLLYADHEQAGGIRIAAGEFALLKTLRNQAVLALSVGGR